MLGCKRFRDARQKSQRNVRPGPTARTKTNGVWQIRHMKLLQVGAAGGTLRERHVAQASTHLKNFFASESGALIAREGKRKIHQTVNANMPRDAQSQKRS